MRVDILFNVIFFSFVNEIVIYSGWLLQKRQRVRNIRNEEPRRLLFCRGRGDRKRDLFFFLFSFFCNSGIATAWTVTAKCIYMFFSVQ